MEGAGRASRRGGATPLSPMLTFTFFESYDEKAQQRQNRSDSNWRVDTCCYAAGKILSSQPRGYCWANSPVAAVPALLWAPLTSYAE